MGPLDGLLIRNGIVTLNQWWMLAFYFRLQNISFAAFIGFASLTMHANRYRAMIFAATSLVKKPI